MADSARDFFLRGRPAPAEAMLRRALGTSRSSARADSVRQALWTELLAESFWRQQRRGAEAESVAQVAVSLNQALYGAQDRAVARALATQARVWRYARGSLVAANGLESALRMYRAASSGPDSVTADMLVSLGNTYRELGRTTDAVSVLQEAVAIRRQVFGNTHRDVARGLLNLALALEVDGAGIERLEVEREAITILEQTVPLDSLGVLRIRMNHAGQLFNTQRPLEAGPHVMRVLALASRLFPPLSQDVANAELAAANYLVAAGDLVGARRRFDACEAIFRTGALGDSSYGEAVFWVNRSQLEELDGRLDSAAACARNAVSILRHDFAARPTALEGVGLASALDRLGQLQAMQNELEDAAASLDEAARWCERYRSAEHPARAHALEQLAAVRLRLGQRDSVREPAQLATGILSRFVRRSLSGMTESEALRYRDRGMALALQVLLSLATFDGSADNIAAAWRAQLRNSGLVAAEIASRRRLLHATRDTSLAANARALVRVRSQLSRSELRFGPDPARDSLRRAAEPLERALASGSSAIARDLAAADVTAERVAAAMPEQTALVHFVRFARVSPDSARVPAGATVAARIGGQAPVWYGAFVLRSGESAPVWVPLARASELEPLMTRWQEVLASGLAADSRALAAGRNLRQRVWDPIERSLRGASTVLLVPEGPLAVLPLTTLPAEDGTPLIERGTTIHLLNGVRDLLRDSAPGMERRALVLGGADYAARSQRVPARHDSSAALPAFRGRDRDCRELTAEHHEPLPGSLDEARRVTRTWSKSTGGPAELLTGARASEARVRSNAPGRDLVHLATHGYLVPDSCAWADATDGLLSADLRDVPPPPGSGGILLRTGLVFAGANRPTSDPTDDGLMTAADLAMLDLGEARLIVLSACESGRGNIVGAEGVVGLRWALMQSGARASLTSTHRVSDEATMRWMEHFYSHWLDADKGFAVATREASRDLRRELLERTGEDRPGVWGAFLGVGDWR